MVYNVASNGLSASLWYYHFSLPNVCSILQPVDKDAYIADWYIGGILLNIMLVEEVRPLFGVDFNRVQEEEEKKVIDLEGVIYGK